jgi:signal transduction histidine kinase
MEMYLSDRVTDATAHAMQIHGGLARLGPRTGRGLTAFRKWGAKPTLIVVLIAVITFLHYYTRLSAHHLHLFYQNLYFLPVILAGFWFGLRGGLITSLSITVLYLPFCLINWEGFSPNDANALMEMVLYNVVASILGVLRDQERMRQKRLIEGESLAAMGRAVSCLAHDMKTPLIAIGGFTRQVQRHIDEECRASHDRCREKLEIVIKETERLEHMVKDMLDFARPLIICKDMYRIDQLVEESLAVVRELASQKQVALERETIGEIPSAPLDAERLKQALINLVVNAVQASPPGKTVTVRLHRRKAGELSIDVIDCGCGIPPEKRMEIFQPFVTTKKEGTGLGLPIAKKIVEAHDGRLEILDNREEGSIFRITLPHP